MKSLIEFIADQEETDIEWAKQSLEGMIKLAIEHPYHDGDCTKQNHACNLCVLETILTEYYQYSKTNTMK